VAETGDGREPLRLIAEKGRTTGFIDYGGTALWRSNADATPARTGGGPAPRQMSLAVLPAPSSRFRMHDSGADRVAHQARHAVDAEPFHELVAVALDRLHAEL
jgi:hypothetical protein